MMLSAYCMNDDEISSGRSMTLSLFDAAASASRALARRAISDSETKDDDVVEDGS